MSKHIPKGGNVERLRATLEAVMEDPEHFNQALWCSSPESKRFPEQVGCFFWYANNLYGTPEQIAKFTWDRSHDWVGKYILECDPSSIKTLTWGGATLKDIVKCIEGIEISEENKAKKGK